MKKSSVKKYGIMGGISWIISLVLLLVASQSKEFDLGNVGKYGLGVLGILLFLVAFVFMYKSVTAWFDTDEEAKIEENDERNQLIRGKVAEDVNVFSSVIFSIIMMILLIANEMLGVILIAVGHFAINLYHNFRFKKYSDEL